MANDSRRGFDALHVDVGSIGGVQFAATDGHRLHVADVQGAAEGAVVGVVYFDAASVEKLRKALKAAKPKPRMDEPYVTITATHATIGADTVSLAKSTGEFPDISQVVPPVADNKGAAFGVNPAYLAEAAEAASKIIGGRKDGAVRIQAGATPLAPVRLDAYGEHGAFYAVVMPMRME
jgi:DNA polymerase III sliding clamp (beta) subunit (PCNA family)